MSEIMQITAPRLLAEVPAEQVSSNPFAHVLVRPAIPADAFAELARTFPTLDRIAGPGPYPSNKAVRLNATQVLADSSIPGLWRDFFRHHVSGDFWRDIVRLLGPEMRRVFPKLEAEVGKPFEDWTVVRRGEEAPHDLRLDCQFVMNTPVTQVSTVKAAHIDDSDKIFSGLLYFRDPADASSGSNLDLYRWKREPRFLKHKAMDRDVEVTATVPYQANTFIGFVNSIHAVHGVSPRSITGVPRRYINFIAEMPRRFYKPQQVEGFAKLWSRLTEPKEAPEEKY